MQKTPPHQRPARLQRALPLEPQPEQVLEEAQRIWLSLPYWRRRYQTLEALLADPLRARLLLTCARQGLRARWRGNSRP